MAELDQPTRDVFARLQLATNNAPAVTPSLLAYLRGLDMNMSQLEDTRRQRIGELTRRKAMGVANVNQASGTERRNLTGDLLSRGVYRSGEANTRYADQSARTQQRLGELETTTAENLGAVERATEQGTTQLRQAAMERMLGAESDEAIRKAQEEAQLRQERAVQEFYKKMGG